jgi:nucleoside-diphosphate-sugar epimerase
VRRAVGETPKRVVLTGASGFIGANLTRRLIDDGHEVHLLLRPVEERWRIDALLNDVQVHEVALQQRDRLQEIVTEIDPQWVFHLATYGAYSSQRDVQTIVSTNYNGTVNLVEACLETGFETFVSAGSSSEYGYKDHAPVESELTEPNSHYAATKAAAALYCRFIAQSRQRQLSTLRLYSVFGPWEDPTRLLPRLLVCGLRGDLPPLVSATVARDYVYIDDAVEAFILAAKTPTEDPGAVFNVGTGVQTTLGELVEVARQQFQITREPEWGSMPDRQWDTDVWVSDPNEIRASLGWKPAFDLSDGLHAFANWLTSDPCVRHRYETTDTPPQ